MECNERFKSTKAERQSGAGEVVLRQREGVTPCHVM